MAQGQTMNMTFLLYLAAFLLLLRGGFYDIVAGSLGIFHVRSAHPRNGSVQRGVPDPTTAKVGCTGPYERRTTRLASCSSLIS